MRFYTDVAEGVCQKLRHGMTAGIGTLEQGGTAGIRTLGCGMTAGIRTPGQWDSSTSSE